MGYVLQTYNLTHMQRFRVAFIKFTHFYYKWDLHMTILNKLFVLKRIEDDLSYLTKKHLYVKLDKSTRVHISRFDLMYKIILYKLFN